MGNLGGVKTLFALLTATEPAVPKFTDPGKWYFVVDCLDCESPIPLADAPSPAEKPHPLRYRVISKVKCPHCGGVGTYTPTQISRRLVDRTPGDRFQAPILYIFAGIAGLSFLAGVLVPPGMRLEFGGAISSNMRLSFQAARSIG